MGKIIMFPTKERDSASEGAGGLAELINIPSVEGLYDENRITIGPETVALVRQIYKRSPGALRKLEELERALEQARIEFIAKHSRSKELGQ